MHSRAASVPPTPVLAIPQNLSNTRHNTRAYRKYAAWEETQGAFERARSIYERAIDIDYRDPALWLNYAEMEMRHKHVNRARNVWDRAVTFLPRIDQMWYKYIHMEETLGNVSGARQLFERWTEWEPQAKAWQSYVAFEMRYREIERARAIYERFVTCHPQLDSWMRYAQFEQKQKDVARARVVFERALQVLAAGGQTDESLFLAFADLEEEAGEYERARVIYTYALDNVPKARAVDLFNRFASFEKRNGRREGIEDVVVAKRRFEYEEEVKRTPDDYDLWFAYARLEETAGDVERVRNVYERAVERVPRSVEKAAWERYIYLWIQYAIFEELTAEDMERTRLVYATALKVVPHQHFTFAKIWVLFAKFELRQLDLTSARKILGHGLGVAARDSMFRAYIDIELQLGNLDRVRTLYQKWLERSPANCRAWVAFAELETNLGEEERARGVFELAVARPMLDMPEVLWKAYIDFEIENEAAERVRALYERLLEKTTHVKVWASFAQYEASTGNVERARDVFRRAERVEGITKDDRAAIIESWRAMEAQLGDAESLKAIEARVPKRVKRHRPIVLVDGTEAGVEEFYDYVFPEDEKAQPNLKLLQMAQMWKKAKEAGQGDDE